MDFTYFIAGFLALCIGFAAAALFAILGGRALWKLALTIIGLSVLLDFALLLDWQRTEEMSVEFLLMDLAFFAAYAIIGGALGAMPVLVFRRVWNWAKQRDA